MSRKAHLSFRSVDGRGREYAHDGAEVTVLGYEGERGTVVTTNDDLIIVKMPGRHYWRGRGMASGYGGAEFQVWQVVPWDDGRVAQRGDQVVKAVERVSWPVRPPKEARS